MTASHTPTPPSPADGPALSTTLLIDKPYTWTSFDVVNKIRRELCRHLGVKKLKVGHAGTLDPLATGLMLVCTGRATKSIDTLQAQTKEYVATLALGATTPSFDLEHDIDARYPVDHITAELVHATLQQFRGRIEQVPPAFSAVKVDGHRAYALARRGRDVELAPKELVIDELEVTDASRLPHELTLRIVCSKGTYIRALARDIGQALGSGAHLLALRRTRIGPYAVDQAMTLDAFHAWLQTLPHPTPNTPTITPL